MVCLRNRFRKCFDTTLTLTIPLVMEQLQDVRSPTPYGILSRRLCRQAVKLARNAYCAPRAPEICGAERVAWLSPRQGTVDGDDGLLPYEQSARQLDDRGGQIEGFGRCP